MKYPLRIYIKHHWQILLLCFLIVLLYFFYLAPRCARFRYITWDALRDVWTTQHIMAGGSIIADPVLRGFYHWYPPLHAAFCASMISWFQLDTFQFYALTPVMLNWIFILAFYFLTQKLIQNRNASFWATLTLAVMPWLITYVFAFPTVMAHAVGLCILLWLWFLKLCNTESLGQWLTFSLCCGLMGYYHPPTFLILSSVIGLNLLWEIWLSNNRQKAVYRLIIFIAVSFSICSPYWILNLLQPVNNPVPLRYISPALMQKEIVLPGTSWLRSLPFLIPAGIGLWAVIKHSPKLPSRFILVFLLVTVIGQLPAYFLKITQNYYPNSTFEKWIPVLLPHEFQLYFQLLLCILLGWGIKEIWAWKEKWLPIIYKMLMVPFLLSLGLSLCELPSRSQVFLWPHRSHAEWKGAIDYIETATNVQDVFCTPSDHVSFFVVGVYTGRKCLLTYPSHLNIHADAEKRRHVRESILHTASLDEIKSITRVYHLKYILCKFNQIPRDRITFFKHSFETVFDDGTVFIFKI